MTVFNSIDLSTFLSFTVFSFIWLLICSIWVYFAWPVKLFRYVGMVFLFFGALVNCFHIYYYWDDNTVLSSGEFNLAEGQVDYFDNSYDRRTIFGVQGKRFKCDKHSNWVKPSLEDCKHLKQGTLVKVTYIVNGERGHWPAGHRVLKIER